MVQNAIINKIEVLERDIAFYKNTIRVLEGNIAKKEAEKAPYIEFLENVNNQSNEQKPKNFLSKLFEGKKQKVVYDEVEIKEANRAINDLQFEQGAIKRDIVDLMKKYNRAQLELKSTKKQVRSNWNQMLLHGDDLFEHEFSETKNEQKRSKVKPEDTKTEVKNNIQLDSKTQKTIEQEAVETRTRHREVHVSLESKEEVKNSSQLNSKAQNAIKRESVEANTEHRRTAVELEPAKKEVRSNGIERDQKNYDTARREPLRSRRIHRRAKRGLESAQKEPVNNSIE